MALASPDLETRLVQLTRQYGSRWVIYRDRYGTHEQWVAEPRRPGDGVPAKVVACGIDGLAEKLAAAES